ncbi:hypothetical protein ACMFMF_006195 [Clarireedia jacksonii]
MLPAATVLALDSQVVADGCVQGNFKDLVIRNSCGDDLSIAKCLTSDVDLRSLSQIEQCFIAGGCDATDSSISAVWFSFECNAYEVPVEEVMRDDLKKRATETSGSSSKTEASTTTTTSAETTTSASSTSASSASAAAASTTSATSTTSGSSTSATTTSSGSSSTSTSLACSTTKYISTSACSFGTGKSTGVTIGCTPTTSPSATCAKGVLCTTAASGEDVCMLKDDSLTTSGLVVTIVFAVGLAGFLIGFIVMTCQDRSATKKRRAAHIAMLEAESKEALQNMERQRASAKQAATAGQADANVPLIS